MVEGAAICGFDIGSENCYVAVARQGGIEILLNDYSQRSTPAFICLGGKQREIGVSAKQKHLMNLNNTFYAIKRLVGRQYNEVLQNERVDFPIQQAPNGEVAIRVIINDEENIFTATQLLAMLLSKLRQVSNMAIDCVLNCPDYFTDGQRRALRDAAIISGLNPLRIVNDMTAVGINYNFFRLTNVASSDNAIIGFVNCGNTTTQCSFIFYDTKKNQMVVLSSEHDAYLGGRDFDERIASYLIEQHNLKINKRARLRLIAECEKLKKQMSANSNQLPINVECLYEDRDFTSRLDRTLFEELSKSDLERIEQVFKRSLESAKNTFSSSFKDAKFHIDAVEIVGGSSRIPSIKRLIKQVFNIEPSTTLNADEAVCRGCALQCALLSPAFKVSKELNVVDYIPYQINCKYWYESQPEGKVYTINPLFSRGGQMPFTRQIIINCHSLPMIFELEYVNEGHTTSIGQFRIDSNEKIDLTGTKLKVRVRIDANGLVYVSSATLQKEDKSAKKNEENSGTRDAKQNSEEMNNDTEANEQKSNDANHVNDKDKSNEKPEEEKNKEPAKPKIMSIDLQVHQLWIRGKLNDQELQEYRDIEYNLILADKNIKERMDARNSLEEYVYEWRDKLEVGSYDNFVTPSDKQTFQSELREMEQWLYDDEETGELQSKSVYIDKINHLKKYYSDNILFRLREFETRDNFLEDFGKAIQMGSKLLETKEEVDVNKMNNLRDQLVLKQQWFENCHQQLKSMSLSNNPPITTATIKSETDGLQSLIRPILDDINRKKQEKMREEEKKKREAEEKLKQDKNQDQKKEQSENDEVKKEEPMDWQEGNKTTNQQ